MNIFNCYLVENVTNHYYPAGRRQIFSHPFFQTQTISLKTWVVIIWIKGKNKSISKNMKFNFTC